MTLSAIGMDDVDGQCGQGSYPLLRAVANVFHSNKDRLTGSKENVCIAKIDILSFDFSVAENKPQ